MRRKEFIESQIFKKVQSLVESKFQCLIDLETVFEVSHFDDSFIVLKYNEIILAGIRLSSIRGEISQDSKSQVSDLLHTTLVIPLYLNYLHRLNGRDEDDSTFLVLNEEDEFSFFKKALLLHEESGNYSLVQFSDIRSQIKRIEDFDSLCDTTILVGNFQSIPKHEQELLTSYLSRSHECQGPIFILSNLMWY